MAQLKGLWSALLDVADPQDREDLALVAVAIQVHFAGRAAPERAGAGDMAGRVEGPPLRRGGRVPAPRPVTGSSYRRDSAGLGNAYATASGGSARIGNASSSRTNPNVNPATAPRRTREKRNPTNPEGFTRRRRKFSIGHSRGRGSGFALHA